MDETLDKLERARFLAVQRLRRSNAHAADLLDYALILENLLDGSFSIHLVATSNGRPIDLEIAELGKEEAESASEEEFADQIAEVTRKAVKSGMKIEGGPE